MPVAELLERISSRELSEWMMFMQVEPFGSEASYIGHAITAQTIANANRQKGKKPYKVKDFMPQFERQEQSVEEMVQFAQVMTLGLGGEDRRESSEDEE